MALKYLQENNLQEQLNSSIKELAISKPEDLYFALGTELEKLTKPAEIISERTVPDVNSGEDEIFKSPMDFTGIWGLSFISRPFSTKKFSPSPFEGLLVVAVFRKNVVARA